MSDVRLEDLDVKAEIDALAERERKKLEDFRRTRGLGQEATLRSLENRIESCAAALKNLDSVERIHEKKLSAISADWRTELIYEKRSEILRDSVNAADEVHVAVAEERDAARMEATLFSPRGIRRRARFDDKDPARDAQIRGTWITRLSRMSLEGLVDLAEEARDVGNDALAGALEEELDSRYSALEAGTQTEREMARKIRNAIDSVELPELERAKFALAEVERAEREVSERIRILRGGRPGGLSDIREGLLQRQAQAGR